MVSQALLISTSAFKFSKVAILSEILTHYCSLPSISLNFFRLNLSIWNLCIVCLLTASLSLLLPPPDSCQYHNLLPRTIRLQVHLNAISYLSKYGQFIMSLSTRRWASKFMNVMRWEHSAFDRFFYVAKFTTLTPFSLLISYAQLLDATYKPITQ
jgi:hypothetical protein